MKNPLTKEEHVELSKKLSIIAHNLNEITQTLYSHYNTTSKLYKTINKLDPRNPNGLFGDLRCYLDDEWCKIISNGENDKYGFIYYALDKIYEELNKDDTTRTNQE